MSYVRTQDASKITVCNGDGTKERPDFAWIEIVVRASSCDETGACPSLELRVPVLFSSSLSFEELEAKAITKAKAMLGEAVKAL